MKKQRPISSAALGDRGEARFKDICSCVPDLIVNKSHDQDRAGWDYVIDFAAPVRASASSTRALAVSHDTLPPPISCRVQVKSIWRDNDAVSFRLSSLARLANYPGPAFIYVLKFGEDLKPTSAHLIHLLGDNFGAVLRRLRQEENAGKVAINRLKMSFSPSQAGQLLPVTGAALRHAIVSAVGGEDRLADYIGEKRLQFQTLGFEENAYKGSISFKGDIAEIVDASLGIGSAQVAKFQMVVTRFGISLDQFREPITDGVMTIAPSNPVMCRLIARPLDGSPPITTDVEFRAPGIPNLPSEHHKMLILGKVFRITLTDERSKFVSQPNIFEEGVLALDDWRSCFRFFHAAATCGLELELTNPTIGAAHVGRIESSSLSNTDITIIKNALFLCDMANDVSTLTGEPLPAFRWRELEAAATEMSNCLAFRNGGEGEIKIRVTDWGKVPKEPFPINYFYAFPVGGAIVAYSVASTGTITPDPKTSDASVKLNLKTLGFVRLLRNLDDDYSRFKKLVESRTKIDDAVTWASDRFSPQPPTQTAA